MGLIERISRGAVGFRADISGTPAPWDDYWYNPLGFASASGMRISPESAKRQSTVLACVSILARNIAMLPTGIFTHSADGGTRAVPHHPVYELLATRPNKHQTAFEFKQMMQGHLELRGNAYAEILDGPRGAVDQLIPMQPDRVTVDRLKSTGRIRYKYTDPLTSEVRTLMEDEVFHLRNFSDDGVVGQSTISMGCDVIGNALGAQDYQARFFKNDATPRGIIEGANFKTKDIEDEFIANWQRTGTGENRHKTRLLPPGLTYKEIGVKPSDAQLLESQKLSDVKICSIFGVPGHMVGIVEKAATFASVEQFTILFAVQSILPRLVLWEQAIQRDLILNPRYFCKFDMSELLRGDTVARTAYYGAGFSQGWLSPNDIRRKEGMNPIEDGDTYWRQAAMIPLAQISSPVTAPIVPQKGPKDADGTDEADKIADDSDKKADDPEARARLMLMVTAAAERCVRREVNGATRLIERGANGYEIVEFYVEQAKFVSEVLHLSLEKKMEIEQKHRKNAEILEDFLVLGKKKQALDWLNRIAGIEAAELAIAAA